MESSILNYEYLGLLREDGSIERDVKGCYISMKPVLGHHSIKVRLFGPYFLRVLSEKVYLLTEDFLSEIRETLRRDLESRSDNSSILSSDDFSDQGNQSVSKSASKKGR